MRRTWVISDTASRGVALCIMLVVGACAESASAPVVPTVTIEVLATAVADPPSVGAPLPGTIVVNARTVYPCDDTELIPRIERAGVELTLTVESRLQEWCQRDAQIIRDYRATLTAVPAGTWRMRVVHHPFPGSSALPPDTVFLSDVVVP